MLIKNRWLNGWQSIGRIVGLLLLGTVMACGDTQENYRITPFSVAYNDGLRLLQERDYQNAASRFSVAIQQHPYNQLVAEAQLLLAYTYFLATDYDLANLELETFISVYPTNQHLPYAIYLRAMCFFVQISIVERDQYITRQAQDIFSQLIGAFPESSYAKDARYKVDFLNNLLAAKEMDIGRFYLWRGEVGSAMRRFNEVITNYPTTEQVPEALYRMVEGYLSLGLSEEAYAMGFLLGHNYKDNIWYQMGYTLLDEAGVKKP